MRSLAVAAGPAAVLGATGCGGSGAPPALPPGSVQVAASDLVLGGDSGVFAIDDVPAGSYRVICDRPGHGSAGMKGTLSVG